jgi:hypothetical protein
MNDTLENVERCHLFTLLEKLHSMTDLISDLVQVRIQCIRILGFGRRKL